MKFSPWFSCDNPPVRSGYYDIHDCITGYVNRRYYDVDKREWRQFSNSVEPVVYVFRDRWRGMMNGGEEMKLTPWFPGDVKPVRKGVYQRHTKPLYSYWNGVYWCVTTATISDAREWKVAKSYEQNCPWRGVMK